MKISDIEPNRYEKVGCCTGAATKVEGFEGQQQYKTQAGEVNQKYFFWCWSINIQSTKAVVCIRRVFPPQLCLNSSCQCNKV